MTAACEAEMAAVDAAAATAIARVTAVLDHRAAAHATLDDWTGPHREAFDGQFPSSQGDLAWLIDIIQRAREQARTAVAGVLADAYVAASQDEDDA